MRIFEAVVAGMAATTVALSVAGCHGKSTSTAPSATTPTSSVSAPSGDYRGLLIQAADIDAPIPFTAAAPTSNPNGQPGVATTFSTDDGSHVIKDTIAVLTDPAAATNALTAAKGNQANVVKNPATQPSSVGTGGMTLLGNAPDGSKGVTVLLFTQGRAFVTLEFDGPRDMLAPPDFVTNVGQKQAAAVKKGLGS